ARAGAARAAGRAAVGATGACAACVRVTGARGRAAFRLARAHGASLPAGDAVPRALPRTAPAPGPLRLRRRDGGAVAGRPGGRLPRAARAAACEPRLNQPAGAVRPDPRLADAGKRRPKRKDRTVDRPLRLITANPLDALARTLEGLLVVASAPLPVEELAAAV